MQSCPRPAALIFREFAVSQQPGSRCLRTISQPVHKGYTISWPLRSVFTSSRPSPAQEATPPKPTIPPTDLRAAVSPQSTIPSTKTSSDTANLTSSFSDTPLQLSKNDPTQVDWTTSFHGLATEPFSRETADALQQALDPEDIEIKPDGIIYLPEIKYRRIMNKAFGPGGWGLAPRGESIVTNKAVTREYALLAHGR